MAYQYYDRAPPHGIPDYDMQPSPARRPAPPSNYHPDQRRGPPPVRPPRPGGPPPPQNYPSRPPPQHYSQSAAMDSVDSLYDGSAYGGADDEPETWPLPARPFAQSARPNSPGGSPRGSPRRPLPDQGGESSRRPPQRPQRPDYHEPMSDPPRPSIAPADRAYRQAVPPPQRSYHGSGQWTGDGYRPSQPMYPSQSSQSSRAPPQSPAGSIPDYQMPQALQQTIHGMRNARPPLGPPPSSRKGPPSYYPQIAPVHPIAEETDTMRGSIRNASVAFDPAHSSYASSNAIPIGIPGYYVQDRGSARSLPYEQHGQQPSIDSIHEYPPERDFDSREQPSPEPASLIRQASLGKRSKPTLTTVKSSERARGEAGVMPQHQQRATFAAPAGDKEAYMGRPSISSLSSDGEGDDKIIEGGGFAAIAAGAIAVPSKARLAPGDPRQQTPESALSTGTGLLDASDSESEEQLRKKPSKELLTAAMPKEQLSRSQPRSPLAPSDPLADEILGSLQKSSGTLPGPIDPDLASPGAGLSSRPSKRRPARLDVDAVRDAEARGSLTSLPDLIRRATKLAGNLDRGRTASRLGMNFFVDGMEGDQEKSASDKRGSGSISDILNSFPPPTGVHGSRPGSRGGVSMSRWSSNLRHSHLPSDSDAEEIRNRKTGRRCCGMPLWLFILLVTTLLLLVAAAVLVPIVLLVIVPGQHSNSSTHTITNKALQSCHSQLACANGGVNIISGDGYCRCVCTGGYSGSTCATSSPSGCTTISSGSVPNATVGDDIPRLVKSADSNFSIPLNTETLLGLFSSSDMTCSSENDLVTFTNIARLTPSTASSLVPRDSIPIASGRTVDFARVALLYILQLSADTSIAITAQIAFQSYFQTGATPRGLTVSASNVTLGNGYSADLQGLRLDTGNGTVVGVGI